MGLSAMVPKVLEGPRLGSIRYFQNCRPQSGAVCNLALNVLYSDIVLYLLYLNVLYLHVVFVLIVHRAHLLFIVCSKILLLLC